MPWPAGAVDKLVALLLEGHRSIPVIEAFDQRGLITRMLPEWEPVRSRPQRNAYHRYTVDRHLWEAAANASELADHVARPDLLVLGALFHDIGKGYPGDHTEVGMAIVRELGARLGLGEADVDTLVAMVEHHLLLPDVAVRRDLSDPATIRAVADAVGSPERLELLHRLTEADSIATGPSAWGPWKQALVDELVARVEVVLGGGDVADATWTLFPDAETLQSMATGKHHVRVDDDRLTIVYRDEPGMFSRIAGVVSLHGLDVATARAHSDEPQLGRVSMGASEFRVHVPDGGIDWPPIIADLERALQGRLAIESRLGRAGPHVSASACHAGGSAGSHRSVDVPRRSVVGRHRDRGAVRDSDRHPLPHHEGARRGRARHPSRHGADRRSRRRRHVLRPELVGRADHRCRSIGPRSSARSCTRSADRG